MTTARRVRRDVLGALQTQARVDHPTLRPSLAR
jgi:hypothetical protein